MHHHSASGRSFPRMCLRCSQCMAVPSVEVIPDDTKRANHGAVICDIDSDPLFFLQARGIEQDRARYLLMQSFALDVVKKIPDARTRLRVLQKLDEMVPPHILRMRDTDVTRRLVGLWVPTGGWN
eukprot:GHVU01232139.1.p1 GENE.GHVU01232139.1~~GHVU01232139.1.p1  ORF type:complete len:125 (-),score=11.85 GHVU01232139.1:91-465(-)